MPTTNHPNRRERAPRAALGSSLIGSLSAATPQAADPGEPEQRHAMIREAAYFLAECRGFGSGHELEDWLAAEQQIELALSLDRAARALSS